MRSIVGTWRLAAAAAHDGKGQPLPPPLGAQGLGRGAFSPRGRMMSGVSRGRPAPPPPRPAATLAHATTGPTQGGRRGASFTVTNAHGLRVRCLSLGGVITGGDVPDRTGRPGNIVLGLATLEGYETLPGHYGAITGRYANRIGGAQFTLDGQTYHLIANNGANTLHGGPNALDRRVWTVSPTPAPDGVAATLSYVSKDGDQNFPGTLTTYVTYTLTNDNALRIDYRASTDKDTVINFTNHSYFNLAGNGSGSVADQMLLVN